MQDVKIFYVDDVRSAENKMAAAVSTLGQGLDPLSNGMHDSGMRNDAFHAVKRWSEALCWSSGLRVVVHRHLPSKISSCFSCIHSSDLILLDESLLTAEKHMRNVSKIFFQPEEPFNDMSEFLLATSMTWEDVDKQKLALENTYRVYSLILLSRTGVFCNT